MGYKISIRLLLIIIAVLISDGVFAQNQRLEGQINSFKKQDSTTKPVKDVILLIGSSSFTNWKDVQAYFPDKKILNRGFGGSTLVDVDNFLKDLVFAYQPKQILIYCGENDFGSSDTIGVKTVVNRFKNIYDKIRARDNKVMITFVSMKPSPRRKHLMNKMALANQQISEFLKTQKKASYIDVYFRMLTDKAEPMPEIFLADKLHMNASGYQIWQKAFRPYLL